MDRWNLKILKYDSFAPRDLNFYLNFWGQRKLV